jgi:hypothetical protein
VKREPQEGGTGSRWLGSAMATRYSNHRHGNTENLEQEGQSMDSKVFVALPVHALPCLPLSAPLWSAAATGRGGVPANRVERRTPPRSKSDC